MARGCINVGTSRRDCFDKCFYWKRDEDDAFDRNEYIHNSVYDGIFFAKEITAKNNSKQDVNGLFLFDRDTITIMTRDKVEIKAGDVIKYDGDIWLVNTSQEKDIHKTSQFMRKSFKETYISLSR